MRFLACAERYTQAIVLPRSLKAALVPWFARIPKRTGFRGEWRYGLLNDVRELDRVRLDQTVKRFIALGWDGNADRPIELPAEWRPSLSLDDANLARLRQEHGLGGEPVVALMPGAEYGPAKRWPAPSFAVLARALAQAGRSGLLLGSAKERELGEEIRVPAARARAQSLRRDDARRRRRSARGGGCGRASTPGCCTYSRRPARRWSRLWILVADLHAAAYGARRFSIAESNAARASRASARSVICVAARDRPGDVLEAVRERSRRRTRGQPEPPVTEPSLADKRARSGPKVVTSGAHAVLYDAALREHVDASWFDPAHWQGAHGVERETSGRGAVLIVPHGDETWVVRHYRRGGYVARLIEDHYIWLGDDRSRSFREWRLLRRLHDAGLPVPNPIAAHVRRLGLLYTADIITTYLPDTRKLSAFIAEHNVPWDCWRRIGRMVRAVHEHGVDHPDLTAHNILLDARAASFSRRFRQRAREAAGTVATCWSRALAALAAQGRGRDRHRVRRGGVGRDRGRLRRPPD